MYNVYINTEIHTYIYILNTDKNIYPHLTDPQLVPGGSVHGERANFAELVLGCIEADFCNQILVGKLSPRSTKCTPLHRSPLSIFFPKKLPNFLLTFIDILLHFAKNLQYFDEISLEFCRDLPGENAPASGSSREFSKICSLRK